MHHHRVNHHNVINNSYQWELREINPFDELLVSWNSFRPTDGYYGIYVSVDTGVWSPWLCYAEWGKGIQKGLISKKSKIPVRVYQDAVEVMEEKKGKGFRIKIVAENDAKLSALHSLHVCSSIPKLLVHEDKNYSRSSVFLNVNGLSQMALEDSRKERLCSPTSITAVIRFLNKDIALNPILFAESCWDSGLDIFGNWVFNIAEAYHRLHNPAYSCWVERYENFHKILDSLDKGFPSIISVRGPLPGSAQPYKSGHLLAVIGFDADHQEVVCMDPAFPSDEETIVKYKLNDLLKSWERRKNVAYVFSESPKN